MSTITKLITTSIVLGFCHLPFSAFAQSHDFSQSQLQRKTEARVSLTIPFGTKRKDYKSEPRLAFSVRRYIPQNQFNNDWVLKPSAQSEFSESEFAMSLSQTPQFLVNGQKFEFANNDSAEVSDGVKTAGKIALGAGAVAVVVVGVGFILIATQSSAE